MILVVAPLVTAAALAQADDAGRPGPDRLAPLAAAAGQADLGEIERIASRIPPEALASCIDGGLRLRRLACAEAARYVVPTIEILTALARALPGRDRAVASASGAALRSLLGARPQPDLGASELEPVGALLANSARDARLGPDLRAEALRALRSLRTSVDTAALLRDPDPMVRREAVAWMIERDADRDQLARLAQEDPDEPVGALAAAALCESGRIPPAVDVRVRRWLSDPALGPATLAPLVACARAHAERGAWLEAARASRRPDVRALAAAP